MLFNYQKRILEDQSRFKVVIAARQVGKTRTACVELLRQSLLTNNNLVIYSAQSAENAKNINERVNELLEPIDALGSVRGKREERLGLLSFSNGSKMLRVSSSPRRYRGYTGTAYIDELCVHEDQEELLTAAVPITTTGGKLLVTTTPFGDNNLLYDIVHEPNKYGASVHIITIEDAIKDGWLKWLQTTLPDTDPRKRMKPDDYLKAVEANYASKRLFLREFYCSFAEGNDMLLDNTNITNAFVETNPTGTEGDFVIGVDIGRHRDGTSIVVLQLIPDGSFLVRDVVVLRDQPFASIVEEIKAQIKRWNPLQGFIDQTGIGMMVAEQVEFEFPHIQGFQFTNPSKNELANGLTRAFESGLVKIPMAFEDVLKPELKAVRYKLAAGGYQTFDGRVGDSHCDSVWALGLALKCGFDQTGGVDTVALKRR